MFRTCVALLGLIPLGTDLVAQSNQAEIDRQDSLDRRGSIVGLTGNFPGPKLVRANMDTCNNVGIDMGLCAPITMAMNHSVIIGLYVQPGVTPCSGSVDVDIPVPPDIRLCGYTFSAQFGMVCEMLSGTGSAVSECLQFTVNGS